MGPRPIVDVLIGLDCADLHIILTEILEVNQDSQLPDLPRSDGHVLVPYTTSLNQDCQLILQGLTSLQIT